MSMFKSVTVILLMIFPLSVAAQTLPVAEKKESTRQSVSNSLRGKHSIALGIGLLGKMTVRNEVSAGGVTNSVEEREFLGSIAYTYWLENNLGFNFSLGVLGIDVTNSVKGSEVSTETGTVLPMLFGVKYQPFRLTTSDVLRPYVLASVGPLFGSATMNRVGVKIESESYLEAALSSRLGAWTCYSANGLRSVLVLAIILLPILKGLSDRRRTIAVPSSPYLLESFLGTGKNNGMEA